MKHFLVRCRLASIYISPEPTTHEPLPVQNSEQTINTRPTYSVKQSDRNSSKTDLFHKPTTYEQHVKTNSKQIITVARHEYGQVELRWDN